jgi:hypothetical protein
MNISRRRRAIAKPATESRGEAMTAMRALPLDDVVLMLRGWRDENRVIQFHLCDSEDTGFTCLGFGQIEEIDRDFLRIKTLFVDQKYGCTVSLSLGRADQFSIWDWRDVPPEEPLRKELLQESYDVILTAAFAGARCVLHLLKEPADLYRRKDSPA